MKAIRQIRVDTRCTNCTADIGADVPGPKLSNGSNRDCYGNAAMETFWASLKREIARLRGSSDMATCRDACRFLFKLIEVFFNRQHHQTSLGDKTPIEVRNDLLAVTE